MSARPATAFRIVLSLLLGACLLLQGTVALALATGMASHAAEAEAADTAVPPCHGAGEASTALAVEAAGDPGPGCCEAAGGLCEWACTLSPPVPTTPGAPPGSRPAIQALHDPGIAALPWRAATPLRPPIS